jgi:hypothetical protein
MGNLAFAGEYLSDEFFRKTEIERRYVAKATRSAIDFY